MWTPRYYLQTVRGRLSSLPEPVDVCNLNGVLKCIAKLCMVTPGSLVCGNHQYFFHSQGGYTWCFLLGFTFHPDDGGSLTQKAPLSTPCAVTARNFVLISFPSSLSLCREANWVAVRQSIDPRIHRLIAGESWAVPPWLPQRMGKPCRRHLTTSHSPAAYSTHWHRCVNAGKTELRDACDRSRGKHRAAANTEVCTLRPECGYSPCQCRNIPDVQKCVLTEL